MSNEPAISAPDACRVRELLRRLGGSDEGFAQLHADLGGPGRAYHNGGHVADCLRQFDAARDLAERPDEVEAAIWFHDAVYDPRAADNEERSAACAAEAMTGAEAGVVERVVQLILATKHDREPAGADAELLVDIDLSILGREPGEFAAYDAAIRAEYAWVPEADYRAGRRRVLEGFLARPAIYRTARFRAMYESAARRNLAGAVAALS